MREGPRRIGAIRWRSTDIDTSNAYGVNSRSARRRQGETQKPSKSVQPIRVEVLEGVPVGACENNPIWLPTQRPGRLTNGEPTVVKDTPSRL